MNLSDPQTIQILSIAFLWVIALSAIRFAAITLATLYPLTRAIWRSLRWRMDRTDSFREWLAAVDSLQMRFSIAMMTPWSLPLLFFGLGLMGVSSALLSGGDVMVLVARRPEMWSNYNWYLDWTGALTGASGMAATLAALSKRRTVSFLISTSFAITGLGIGIVAAVYV